MLTGYLATLPTDTLLSAGVLFCMRSGVLTRIGVTDGAPDFDPGVELSEVMFDNRAPSRLKGLTRRVGMSPVIKGTLKEFGPSASGQQIAVLEPGVSEATVSGTTTETVKAAGALYAAGDYIVDFRWIFERAGGGYACIYAPVAIVRKWSAKGNDKKEAAIAFEIECVGDPVVSTFAVPYAIELRTNINIVSEDGSIADVTALVGAKIIDWWEPLNAYTVRDGTGTHVDHLTPIIGARILQAFTTGANLPTWDAVNERSSTDGATNYYWTGEQAAYDPSTGPKVLVLLSSVNPGTSAFTAAFEKLDLSHFATIYKNGGGKITLQFEGNDLPTDIAPTASLRLTIVELENSHGGTGTLINPIRAIEIPGYLRRLWSKSSSTALPAGNYGLAFGTLKGGGILPSAETLIGMMLLNDYPTLAETQALQRRLIARGGSVVASPPIGMVHIGDSRTFGFGATPGTNDYVTQLQALIGAGYTCDNRGVSSRTLAEMLSMESPLVLSDGNPLRSQNVVWLWGGVNDGGSTGTTMLSETATFAANARAAGFHVGVVLEIPPTDATAMSILNPGILTLLSNGAIDYVARTDLEPHLQNPADTTYFFDGLHLTATGYGLIAARVKTAMGL